MKQVHLLTGRPRAGKTRLIREAITTIKGKVGGFYTEEICHNGIRQGFQLTTLDGQSTILAHVKINSQYRMGKYGVDIANLERIGITALQKAMKQSDIVVVDEIGKMEILSVHFKQTIMEMLDSKKRILGTIMLNSHPWTNIIKHLPQVQLLLLSQANYYHIALELQEWLQTTDKDKI